MEGGKRFCILKVPRRRFESSGAGRIEGYDENYRCCLSNVRCSFGRMWVKEGGRSQEVKRYLAGGMDVQGRVG